MKSNTDNAFVDKFHLSSIFNEEGLFFKSLMIHLFVIILKVFVGLFGYSGEHDPPKYGDYEAQRHWMELTINLPKSEWYTTSIDNPQDYWPMDYPPLSGYHSYICGFILKYLIPESVKIFTSYGYESPGHKIIMRLFSLFSDIFVYHIAVQLLVKFIYIDYKRKNYLKYYIGLFVFLLSPCLVIIDHGHFQFNAVMHGFFIYAVYFLLSDQICLAVLYYSLSFNFKIMGVYYALPFPLLVIRKLFFNDSHKNQLSMNVLKVCLYAFIAIVVNMIIWSPWIISNKIGDVFARIFPVWRGIFEDKVANFWCVLNIIIKVKNIPTNIMLKISLFMTILSNLFPGLCIIYGNKQKLMKIVKLSFFICSFGFYLFSFHVHEKTIMVPYLAFCVCYNEMREYLFSFSLFSMLSMYPLLKREFQVFPYFVLSFIFSLVSLVIKDSLKGNKKRRAVDEVEKKKPSLIKQIEMNYSWFMNLSSMILFIGYHICEVTIPAPEKYPWFYPMINSVICFGYFALIFMVGNVKLYNYSFNRSEHKKIL